MNPTSACYKFNLRTEDIQHIKDLGLEQIQAIVANVDQCLFCVRRELLDILHVAPGLAGILATARKTENKSDDKPNNQLLTHIKNSFNYETA